MSGTAVGLLFAIGLAPLPAMGQELPSGGSVTSGAATITQSGSSLLVNQSSRNAIISWHGFSISGGASAHFENGTGATLNRVTGNLPSSIEGSLTATGSLYLINPAGVAVGTGGMVRTGGSFVASTHDTSDADFLDGGDLTLTGSSKAGVVNRGYIASLNGDVVLTARRVENSGTINAPGGSAGLLGGYEVLLRDTSLADGKFAVKVGGDDTEVVNTGTVRAAEVELRANGGSVQALAGNTKAIVKATGVKKVGGRIFLTAGEGGSVKATQRLVARRADKAAQRQQVAALPDQVPLPAARPDYSGGEVHVAGGSISLGGAIDAAGADGAGGAIVAAAANALDLGATANLDASGSNGGLVLLGGDFQGGKDPSANYWSAPLVTTVRTSVAKGATIAADGDSGAGGQIVVWADDHTSFAGHISATGTTVGGDAEVSGKAVLEFAGTADLTSTSGSFGTLLLDPYNLSIVAGAGGGFTARANDSTLGADTLLAALNTANVTVSTGAGGGQAGDITVAAPLAWTSDATLTLDAAGAIAIDAGITARAGGLTLDAGAAIGATGAIDIARFTLAAGAWTQNAATLPSFATGDFRIDAGASFLRTASGDGSTATPWALTDIYGVQGMGTRLDNNFTLANDIDAAGTSYWNGGLGFAPVGNGSSPFTGSFDGKGHAITGLTINRPTQDYVGLFGRTNGATITNVGLDGGTITGRFCVGGLVGEQYGGTITQAWASGAIKGKDSVGGLVGGQIGGSISQAWAGGAVDGDISVGGLVGGRVAGTIEQAWASGAVTGEIGVGGLVGMQTGGSVTDSFWDMGTTGLVSSAAGTGLTTAQARSKVNYTGWDFTNDWYQAGDLRPVGRWMANDPVQGVVAVDNLIQLQLMGADLGANYVLTRDIDASATAGTAGSPGIWGAGGFVPVGSNFTQFTGDFDGQGHVISGLTIVRPTQDFVGLFGYARDADIRNVGLEGGAFTGNSDVGALLGMQDGGTTERAWASGPATGISNVGGLVGIQIGGGIIKQAWASGSVSGTGTNVGGLVGLQNNGTIDQAWASGAVGEGGSVGGLLGTQISGAVTRSWASGAVSGNVNLGGLVGLQTGGSVADSFWDIGTSGQASSVAGTGLTTAQARNAVSYTNWNFTTDWHQAGDLRPIGRWMTAAPNANGDIPVSNSIQLQLMGADPAASYVLTRDIDASATAANAANPAGIWGAGGFVPVGYDTTIDSNGFFDGVPFSGSLNGQDHVISGLTINRPTEAYVGLFGRADGAVIGNVGLDGGAVSGSYRVSGLVGFQDGGSVTQSWASATVTGVNGSVGGLVGRQAGGSIAQSWTSGTVTGGSAVGGLVGWQDGGSIAQSWASGAVTGGSTVGGLVGRQAGGSVAASFWDTDTTGQADGLGEAGAGTFSATGLTTAEFQDTADFMALAGAQGWDFKTVWAPPSNGYYPQLYAMSRIVVVDVSTSQRLYGDSNADVTINYYGLGEGDFLTTRATLSGAPDAAAGVGDYAVTTSGGATTTTPEAYRFVYIPGTLAITPRPLTVTGGTIDRVYGDINPAITTAFTAPLGSAGSGGGLVNGDTITSVTVASTADATSGVGSYVFTPGGATFSAGNAANYAITYAGGTLSVTPRAIMVSANDQSRLYGNANPALTWTVGGMGLVNGDTLSGDLATDADQKSGVGDYAITQGSLAASANYDITYTDGTLSVNKRAITVTADDQSRLLGQTDPALTWTVTDGSLASFDHIGGVFSGALIRAPGEAVGDYDITQGSLLANANYAMAFVPGSFTITPAQYTGSQVLERQGDDGTALLLSDTGDGDTTHLCSDGVLGLDCVPYVNAGNRNLGPYIGMTE